MEKVLNISVSAITLSPKTDTDYLNIALIPDSKDQALYAEFTDIDFPKVLSDELFKELFEQQKFNDVSKIDQTIDSHNIRMIKDDRVKLVSTIQDYLYQLSSKYDKIVFWIDEITLWSQFIELIYGNESNNYNLPDYIDFQPIDIKSLIRVSAFKDNVYDYAEELIGKDPDYFNNSLLNASLWLSIKNSILEEK